MRNNNSKPNSMYGSDSVDPPRRSSRSNIGVPPAYLQENFDLDFAHGNRRIWESPADSIPWEKTPARAPSTPASNSSLRSYSETSSVPSLESDTESTDYVARPKPTATPDMCRCQRCRKKSHSHQSTHCHLCDAEFPSSSETRYSRWLDWRLCGMCYSDFGVKYKFNQKKPIGPYSDMVVARGAEVEVRKGQPRGGDADEDGSNDVEGEVVVAVSDDDFIVADDCSIPIIDQACSTSDSISRTTQQPRTTRIPSPELHDIKETAQTLLDRSAHYSDARGPEMPSSEDNSVNQVNVDEDVDVFVPESPTPGARRRPAAPLPALRLTGTPAPRWICMDALYKPLKCDPREEEVRLAVRTHNLIDDLTFLELCILSGMSAEEAHVADREERRVLHERNPRIPLSDELLESLRWGKEEGPILLKKGYSWWGWRL